MEYPYNEGWHVGRKLLPLSECPYHPTSPDGLEWSKGWISGTASAKRQNGTMGATPEQHAAAIHDLGLDREEEEWLGWDLNGPVEGYTYAEYEALQNPHRPDPKYQTWYPDDEYQPDDIKVTVPPGMPQPRYLKFVSSPYLRIASIDQQGNVTGQLQDYSNVTISFNPGTTYRQAIIDLTDKLTRNFTISFQAAADQINALYGSLTSLGTSLGGLDDGPKPPHRAWLTEFDWLSWSEQPVTLTPDQFSASWLVGFPRGPPICGLVSTLHGYPCVLLG